MDAGVLHIYIAVIHIACLLSLQFCLWLCEAIPSFDLIISDLPKYLNSSNDKNITKHLTSESLTSERK